MKDATFPFWVIGFLSGVAMGLLLNYNSGSPEATKTTTIQQVIECRVKVSKDLISEIDKICGTLPPYEEKK